VDSVDEVDGESGGGREEVEIWTMCLLAGEDRGELV
jgi:hypothetical protein